MACAHTDSHTSAALKIKKGTAVLRYSRHRRKHCPLIFFCPRLLQGNSSLVSSNEGVQWWTLNASKDGWGGDQTNKPTVLHHMDNNRLKSYHSKTACPEGLREENDKRQPLETIQNIFPASIF